MKAHRTHISREKWKVLILALIMLWTLCISSALAEKAVYLEFYTGEEARALFERGGMNYVTFDGQRYALAGNYTKYQEDFMMYGGKTMSLYEMTIPKAQQQRFSDGKDAKLGRITISPPAAMTLYVFSGDRSTGMYMMRDPIVLSSAYQEDV